MYGIVNRAIEEMVKANFGDEKWEAIRIESGIEEDYFISNEPYDDAITYKLAGAVSKEMDLSVENVLEAFGEWWILKTGKEKYGGLMDVAGADLRTFLINLPVFHNRIILIYPKLVPPEFRVTDIKEKSLHLHYHSKREGLQSFVRGLLIGLGKLYNTPVALELIQSRPEGSSHEIFKVSW